MVEKLLVLLARTVNDASWLPIYAACLLGVLVALLVVVAIVATFDRKRSPEALKVLKILVGLFRFRRGGK